MSRKLSILSLLAILFVHGPAQAETIGDIRVGDSLVEAAQKLELFGTVQPIRVRSSEGFMAGDFIVMGCRGRVWSVSRQLSRDFQNFIGAAKKAELKFGFEATASLTSDDGRNRLAAVQLKWPLPDKTVYTLSFVQDDRANAVAEAVRASALCEAD